MFTVSNQIKGDWVAGIFSDGKQHMDGVVQYHDDEDEGLTNSIKLNNRELYFFPKPEERSILFLAGPSGVGKSSFMRDWAMFYKLLYNNPVYIISSKSVDPSLDDKLPWGYGRIGGKLNAHQLEINEQNITMFNESTMLENFKNSMFIIDDVFCMDKKLQKLQDKLLEILMKLGRQANISVIVSRHELMELRNKHIKTEADSIVVFKKNFKMDTVNFLKQIGVSKENIKRIISAKDRWTLIKKQAPLYAINNSSIFDISQIEI